MGPRESTKCTMHTTLSGARAFSRRFARPESVLLGQRGDSIQIKSGQRDVPNFENLFQNPALRAVLRRGVWASRAENPRSAIEELARLPDCDFAGLAENCWAEGKRAEAFACLEYAVSNKTGDADEWRVFAAKNI